MLGSTYLQGVWDLNKYSKLSSAITFEKHSVPVTKDNDKILRTGLSKPVDLTTKIDNGNTTDLSSYWFTFLPDSDYFALQVTIAGLGTILGSPVSGAYLALALTFRGSTEANRQAIGKALSVITSITDTVTSAYNASLAYTSAAWDGITQQSKNKLEQPLPANLLKPESASILSSNLPIQTTDNIQPNISLSSQTISGAISSDINNFWDVVPSWSATAWQATTRWSDTAWTSINEWKPETWAATTNWTDNDWNTPFFTISNSSMIEGDSGTKQIVFDVTLSVPSSQTITVNYSTQDNTAISGSDYTSTSGTLTFAPNQTIKNISVSILSDAITEENETFFINLNNPKSAILTDSQGQGTITDNDPLPLISLSANQTVIEGLTSPQNVVYTVTLSNPSSQTITLQYATANGTALSGSDYTSVTGTLTFNPGITSQNITIPILNDSINEANESFTLALTNPTNATLGTISTATSTITDTLTASTTTTLPINVENLTLTGTAAINGTGNAGNNILTGNSANNTLNGGTGNDTLKGGASNDIYLVDSVRDVVIENTNEGQDTIQSAVTSTLTNNVENLTLTGTANINGTGNALDNLITGNSGNNLLKGMNGNDRLIGGTGNDVLVGGAGNDQLTGGGGADQFLFGSGAVFAQTQFGTDTITDFLKGTDKLILSKLSFNVLTSAVGGNLLATEFATINTTTNELTLAGASTAKIVYNSGTGNLFYNQNLATSGLGTGGLFATLTGKPNLGISDFLIQS